MRSIYLSLDHLAGSVSAVTLWCPCPGLNIILYARLGDRARLGHRANSFWFACERGSPVLLRRQSWLICPLRVSLRCLQASSEACHSALSTRFSGGAAQVAHFVPQGSSGSAAYDAAASACRNMCCAIRLASSEVSSPGACRSVSVHRVIAAHSTASSARMCASTCCRLSLERT